jgi:hypothetical protein
MYGVRRGKACRLPSMWRWRLKMKRTLLCLLSLLAPFLTVTPVPPGSSAPASYCVSFDSATCSSQSTYTITGSETCVVNGVSQLCWGSGQAGNITLHMDLASQGFTWGSSHTAAVEACNSVGCSSVSPPYSFVVGIPNVPQPTGN